jgi:hypothetical protein
MSLRLTFKIITDSDNPVYKDLKLIKPFNVRGTMTDHSGTVDTMTGMHGTMIDEVEVWCWQNNCGRRYNEFNTAYGQPAFGFDTEEQLAYFMLRWA